jgi:hypothetical protein
MMDGTVLLKKVGRSDERKFKVLLHYPNNKTVDGSDLMGLKHAWDAY